MNEILIPRFCPTKKLGTFAPQELIFVGSTAFVFYGCCCRGGRCPSALAEKAIKASVAETIPGYFGLRSVARLMSSAEFLGYVSGKAQADMLLELSRTSKALAADQRRPHPLAEKLHVCEDLIASMKEMRHAVAKKKHAGAA